MLSFSRVVFAFLAMLLGLVLAPTSGAARIVQYGAPGEQIIDFATPYRYQRTAPRKKVALPRKAKKHQAYRQTLRGQKQVQRAQVQRRQAVMKRQARLNRQLGLRRAYAPNTRAARQMASLGDMPIARPLAAPAVGAVEVRVDIRSQRMIVKVGGDVAHVWKVSTGKSGFATPRGSYKPQRLHASYFSKKYYNSPMPYSVFFRGGFAIHGTNAISRLGGPASHGCVRLHTANARQLFHLIQRNGPGRTRILIT